MPLPFLRVVEDRIYVVQGRRYLVLNLAQLEKLRRDAPHLIVLREDIGEGEACVDIGPAQP